MRARGSTLRAASAVLCAGALAATVLPATGAGTPPGPDSLRARESSLAGRTRAALQDLYALDTQLARADARAASLDRALASLRSRRRSVDRQWRIARASAQAARLALGRTVRQIYESGPAVDPLAIVLGARSFDDAMTQLDNARQLTLQQRSIVLQVSARSAELRRVSARLAAQTASLRRLDLQAHEAAARLAQARGRRASYIQGLRRQQSLTRQQLARVQEASARAARRTRALEAQVPVTKATTDPTTAPTGTTTTGASSSTSTAEPPAPPRSGGTMRVYATAYDLPGTTASGLPVGLGIVATDPTVIPLGTRFYVPGYGTAVAADTGSAIKGARIDVWLPPGRIGTWTTRWVVIEFL